jgi:hypothetical protein
MIYLNLDQETKIIDGWAGDQLEKLGKSISDGIFQGCVAITNCICDFIFWTSKAGIICCIIIFFASKDKKAVSWGWLFALFYIISSVVISKI